MGPNMRALVTRLRKDGSREKVPATDWPDPGSPKENHVRTRTIYSGITNGTERNDLLRGNYSHKDEELPAGWGYQNVGEVIEIGPEVKNLKVGDILYMSQDHMEFCIEPDDGLHVVLPDDVDKTHAALFGMASVAMRSCRNANLRMGDKLLVVGAGFIGQAAAQIANVMGACVDICDVDERRLYTARKIGAVEEAFNVDGDGWEKNIRELYYNVVLDVAGVPGMETKLITAAANSGTVLFIAGRFKVEYDFGMGQWREITIKQNSHFDNSDLENVCRLTSRGMLRIAPLIQDVVPVSEAGRIYEILRDEPAKLFGTVFDWRAAK